TPDLTRPRAEAPFRRQPWGSAWSLLRAGASLNWGMVPFQTHEIGRLTRLPGWTRAALGGARPDGASTAPPSRSRPRWRRGAGARAGGVREDKEPRLLASGAQVLPKGDDPRQSKGSSLRLQAALWKWSNPRLGPAKREDCVPERLCERTSGLF